jgi:hypothetical protein
MVRQRATTRPNSSGSNRLREPGAVAPSSPRPGQSILKLQKTIGNRAVQRLVEAPEADSEVSRSSESALALHLDNALSSPGHPLDQASQEFMEARFGFDLSGVRLHTNSIAASSADAFNAKAYTVGQDIVFAESQYSPGSSSGQMLIAHELSHVAQQASQPAQASSTDGEMSISEASDDSERAADTMADAVLGAPLSEVHAASPESTGSPTVQREGDSEDENSWVSGLSSVLDLGGHVAEGLGAKGIGGALGATGKGLESGGAAGGGDVIGALSPALDFAGGLAGDLGFPMIGALAKGAGSGMDIGDAFGKGDAFKEAKSVTSGVGTLAEAGGFELSEAGGMGLGELGGLGAAGLAGSAAAVAGSGLAGWEIGKALNDHTSVGGHVQETLGGIDAMLSTPGEGSWVANKSDSMSEDWDKGNYLSAIGSGAELAGVGTLGALGGIGGGIVDLGSAAVSGISSLLGMDDSDSD